MKPVLCLVPAVVLVTACDQSNNGSTSSGQPPRAIIVEDEVPAATIRHETASIAAPRAILIAEPDVADAWEAKIPRALPVSETLEEQVAQPHSRHSRSAQVAERIGEKSKEAAVVAEEHTREAIDIAKEKTEVGLRKAAESTGRFLQDAGEKIEEAAKDAGAP